ncbi:MAG: hypothetical protein EOM66_03885 [Clostridia bacterium]|nr:hypothetical protein [Clostridia bacterium]
MVNPHGMARRALCTLLNRAARVREADICTDARGCQASAPLAWHTDLPPQEALDLAMAGPMVRILEAPLVEQAYLSGGHACFLFSGEAYAAWMAHIIASIPPPVLPDSIQNEVDYAIARMLMLSRKGGRGCPADPRAKEALWLAMGILDAADAHRQTRRLRAARSLVGLMRGRDAEDRRSLAAALGQAADCAARLLAYDDTY